jgi:catechol 2,3-dioxygenase-like lactoylglutathione lyase family enzyme
MNAKFHHAGLVVPDLEKASKFYQTLLGVTEVNRFQWGQNSQNPQEGQVSPEVVASVINLEDSAAKAVMLSGENYNIELFEYSAPAQRGDSAADRPCDPGIAHIAFEFEDIHKACEALKKAGGTLHGDPVMLGDTLVIYGRDPFGNIVELMQPTSA